jgi:putative ABC transporter-associated repeat protein
MAAAALVLASLLALTPVAAGAPAQVVIADGHVDMGPRLDGGLWKIQIRDDTTQPATWRALPDVVLRAAEASKMTVPPGPDYAFLGAAGAPVWLLPQVQRPGVLWPGWNTQDPSIAGLVKREVTWRLHGVAGPGHFALFLNGTFGAPETVFDSAKPFPQETGIEAASHVHGNWAFTELGGYTLDVEMRTDAPDGRVLTDRETLRIVVGDGEVAAASPATSPAPASVAVVAPAETSGNPATWWYVGGGVIAVALLTLLVRLRRSGRVS